MKIAECVFKAQKYVKLKKWQHRNKILFKHKTFAFCGTREPGSPRTKKMELVGGDLVE